MRKIAALVLALTISACATTKAPSYADYREYRDRQIKAGQDYPSFGEWLINVGEGSDFPWLELAKK